jgi:hypothetical protein
MRIRAVVVTLTAAAACTLLSAPADAQSSQRVVRNADRTVVISRDESGRTRTRIVVQRRSYLDPGTQVFPGEVRYNDSIQAVMQSPTAPLSGQGADWDRPYHVLPHIDLPLPPRP